VVVPALYAMGWRRIDHVVVTHPDLDHFGGVEAVVRAMRPRHLWTSGLEDPDPRYQAMLAAAREVGAEVMPLTRAHPVVELGDGARLEVLWPDQPDPSRGKNDGSVVLMLRHGQVSLLLPGDLEAAGEAALVAMGQPLRATVLKAGHHGSQTSSTEAFLDAVRPQVVVYSVGEGNAFGLPHPDVVARYARWGAVSYRTDQDGSIRMVSDGVRLTVSAWTR
jgi:competence protein ComEC